MNLLSEISSSVPYYNRREMLVGDNDQDTIAIIKEIKKQHRHDKKDYDKFSEKFWEGDADSTAHKLFDFHKKHILYVPEPESSQTVKTPGNILREKHGDCKHYSLFTCGVIDSLNRKGYPISCKYRFVSDSPGREVHHVFAVVKEPGGRDIWVDPVLATYDAHPEFHNVKDYSMAAIGAIYRLSGTSFAGTDRGVAVAQVGQSGNWFGDRFRNTNDIKDFMHLDGINPQMAGDMFTGPQEVMQYLHHRIHKPHEPWKGKKFMHKGGVHPMELHRHSMMQGSGIGKKKRKGFLSKFTHSMEVNLSNAGKEAKKLEKGAVQDIKDVGNIVLKVGALPARKAFLGLVALNVFDLAAKGYKEQVANTKNYQNLLKEWKKLGGTPAVLARTIKNGHSKHRIFGGIGQDPATLSAWTALASAVLAGLSKFFNMSAADQKKAADMGKQGTGNMLATAYHHAKMQDADNPAAMAADALSSLTNSGAGGMMSMTPGVDPSTGLPTLQVNGMAHPDLPNDNDQDNGNIDLGNGTFETATGDIVDAQGNPVQNPGGSDASPGGIMMPKGGGAGGLDIIMGKVRAFYAEHKGIIIGTAAVGTGLFVLSEVRKFKKPRRRR